MSTGFGYRHLHYFWVVAKEGGISAAAARRGVAVQTVSAQVRELERELGHALLRPEGRGVSLTEAGRVALRQADLIFALGEQLPAILRDATAAPRVRLAVGISDGVAKLLVSRLLQPVVDQAGLRLLCHEDEFEELLGDLALHRLDAVLADQPAPQNPNLRVYTHPMGRFALAWYAPPALAARAKRGFPAPLARLPVLLPTHHAAVRTRIDRWFEREGIVPNVVGEFEDSALLATFGAAGMGLVPVPASAHQDMTRQGLRRVGPCPGVEDELYLICNERRIAHPLVQRLLGKAVRAQRVSA
jgi:LysR family transcriptional activator of nhaA